MDRVHVNQKTHRALGDLDVKTSYPESVGMPPSLPTSEPEGVSDSPSLAHDRRRNHS
jgi:hypothetical protein